MAALPYLKLYPGDYFADTRHLTCLQHGAYLQLLMSYWTTGGPLPNDDKILAKLVGLGPREWARIRPVIMEFFDVDTQQIVSRRLERELRAAESKSLKAKEARSTGVKRSLNGRSTHHSHSHSHTVSSDASHPSKRKPPIPPKGGESDLFDDEPPNGGSPEGEKYPAHFELWWGEYPNRVGKRKAFAAYEAANKRLGVKTGMRNILLVRLLAQKKVWKRKGVEGRFIPHPTTWLNQGRYDDPAVLTEALRQELPPPDHGPEPELSPAKPKSTVKPKLAPVGWTPDEDR